MTYSDRGYALTEQFEGLRTTAYQDQAGVWSLGYGHTAGICEGMTCTPDQAREWLADDIGSAVAAVNRFIEVEINQNQFDALVDFTFNVGVGNFAESTLLKQVNAGYFATAATEFLRWVYAGGEVSSGLTVRRSAEAALFREPV